MLHVIRPPGETVGYHVGRSFDVLDVEVEVCNDILPTGLTSAEERLRLEVLQRFMIGHHLELRAVEIMAPRTQRMDDGEQLLLVNWISCLGVEHLLRKIGDRL